MANNSEVVGVQMEFDFGDEDVNEKDSNQLDFGSIGGGV